MDEKTGGSAPDVERSSDKSENNQWGVIMLAKYTWGISFFLLMLLVSGTSFSQSWQMQTIASNLSFPGAATGDLDSDGDIDLLIIDGASLVWYENLPRSWERHLIDLNLDGLYGESTLDILDLDRDGDEDVVVNVMAPGGIYWYENHQDGTNWQKHVITDIPNIPLNRISSYGDLDNDGDIDVVSPFYGLPGNILWFDNVSGDTLWNPRLISMLNDPIWTTVMDIDSDGDQDVVAASFGEGHIFWYENVGFPPKWYAHEIATLPQTTYGLCADMDGDGDPDIVTHSFQEEVLVWIENPSWTVHIIAEGSFIVPGIVQDINNDQLPDVSFGCLNLIGWLQNPDDGVLWQSHVVDSSVSGRLFAIGTHDMNFNSRMDIVAVTYDVNTFEGNVRWYGQPLATSLEEDLDADVPVSLELKSNFPNPFNPSTTIQFSLPEAMEVRLAVYNALGQEVATLVEGRLSNGIHHYLWDAGDMPSGVYFYRLSSGTSGEVITHKMLLMR
ncbi:MAG: T9SS C-terminal target domain-containing protein [Methanobacteriota archaeon]|nr:MAG: T9SS C-terminal target domain-containing protein [Euryarchaeota archaeon]